MFARQPLLFQPVEPVTSFTFSEVVEEVRAVFFPEIEGPVEVRFAAESPLASMRVHFMGRDRHVVTFHPVLNHTETPREVVRFLAKHELLHIICRGRFINGWYESHPPEFWEAEHGLAPERYAAWAWIRANLGRCSRNNRSGLAVDRRWRRLREGHRAPYTPWLPFEGERFEQLCPEGGAQLRLPPEWTVRPLPAAVRIR